MTRRPAAVVASVFMLTAAPPPCRGGEPPVSYQREVRPILSHYCSQCHGPDEEAREAGLRFDVREDALSELSDGLHAIAPGHPEQSALLARLTSSDTDLAMPPARLGKRPTPEEIDTLRRWIAEGATYSAHWAYVPPARPHPPEVSDPDWPRNPIDQFVMARLDRERLRPARPADRFTWLRRVALDLTGLPPTADDVNRFADDERPGADERAVDRLLSRPAYGERWAAMWLDLARYGDSAGYIHDPLRSIWRWRDWLIAALNANLPYDQFTAEVLAGDLLSGATTNDIIATGFHRNTTTNTEGGSNAEEYHFASVVDRVNTTMQVWMGSTIACAQCHSHKFDPFTQKDYYRLFAIFNSQEDFNSETPALEVPRTGDEDEFRRLSSAWNDARQRLEQRTAEVDAGQESWEREVDRGSLTGELSAALAVPTDQRSAAQVDAVRNYHRLLDTDWTASDVETKRLRGELDRVATTTMVMKEIPPRPTFVAVRGNFRRPADPVTPGVPEWLPGTASQGPFTRLDLARWLTDPSNPLTARVAVNRLWQELFGIGLVETSEEFGAQGELPSHPELLDWLATEYVRLNWDTKRLLKLIVLSQTYRQSSLGDAAQVAADPNNRLLARGPRVRLSAEQLRDQALAASGLLSAKLYGPPVHPYQPTNGLAAAFGSSTDWETSAGEDRHRRAIYTLWRRNLPYPSMIAFDVPERSVCSLRRIRTNTPVQALVTLNDPVFVEAAQALARRILTEGGDTVASRADWAVRAVLARPADEAEVHRLAALIQRSSELLQDDSTAAEALATRPLGPLPPGMDAVQAAAWTVVGNVLLNLDETLTKR